MNTKYVPARWCEEVLGGPGLRGCESVLGGRWRAGVEMRQGQEQLAAEMAQLKEGQEKMAAMVAQLLVHHQAPAEDD